MAFSVYIFLITGCTTIKYVPRKRRLGSDTNQNLLLLRTPFSFFVCTRVSLSHHTVRHPVPIRSLPSSFFEGTEVLDSNRGSLILDRDQTRPDPDPGEKSSPGSIPIDWVLRLQESGRWFLILVSRFVCFSFVCSSSQLFDGFLRSLVVFIYYSYVYICTKGLE